jgi:hypothetical protein
MSKQTKQLIALIGLVVVAGGIAAFNFLGGDDSPPPPATDAAATPTPTPTPAAGPAPAGGPAATPGAQPGAAPVVVEQDLDIPEPVKPTMPRYKWPWPDGKGYTPGPNEAASFDPLLVQNIDVVDPKRREYIETLKTEWVLVGFLETTQEVPVLGEDGKPVMDENGRPKTEVKRVLEAWFKDKRRPYREKDRLTNTRFTIEKIFLDRVYVSESGADFKIRSGVDLLGDTGAKLTIFLADDDRHESGK